MYRLSHKVKVTCIKSGLSKMVNLDKYSMYEARKVFDFYANHVDYLIEID